MSTCSESTMVAAASSTTTTLPAHRTIFGLWTRSPSASNDIEAQTARYSTEDPFASPSPSSIPAAYTQPTPTPTIPPSREEETFDQVDIFFGVHRPLRSATHESRHDASARPPSVSSPPPYAASTHSKSYSLSRESILPTYAQTLEAEREKEPKTLSMYLFKLGFLFPPLWLLGALILLIPLSAPTTWLPTKSAAERAAVVQRVRVAEVKWAKRSLTALCVLLVIAGLATAISVSIMRNMQ
ncbi:hypothetical protein BD410DRAFT_896723 [Rickenella mellea]|uniref:Uncharacterized protein n=1 Tax=Rickenella mellea TaxID=50990 RepID=A0A4Y7QB73_9AGAM|nr:hypothetical protein BD410DRAFT_896723 [Rickenella mellea]